MGSRTRAAKKSTPPLLEVYQSGLPPPGYQDHLICYYVLQLLQNVVSIIFQWDCCVHHHSKIHLNFQLM
jgi:hypothetical protein